MPWFILLVAGLLEACWAVGLKYTDGFRRPMASTLVGAAIVGSMVLLAAAVRTLPIGTAYAVWTGVGAIGATIGGIFLFHEPTSWPRLFFLALLIASVIGLRVTTPS